MHYEYGWRNGKMENANKKRLNGKEAKETVNEKYIY